MSFFDLSLLEPKSNILIKGPSRSGKTQLVANILAYVGNTHENSGRIGSALVFTDNRLTADFYTSQCGINRVIVYNPACPDGSLALFKQYIQEHKNYISSLYLSKAEPIPIEHSMVIIVDGLEPCHKYDIFKPKTLIELKEYNIYTIMTSQFLLDEYGDILNGNWNYVFYYNTHYDNSQHTFWAVDCKACYRDKLFQGEYIGAGKKLKLMFGDLVNLNMEKKRKHAAYLSSLIDDYVAPTTTATVTTKNAGGDSDSECKIQGDCKINGDCIISGNCIIRGKILTLEKVDL